MHPIYQPYTEPDAESWIHCAAILSTRMEFGGYDRGDCRLAIECLQAALRLKGHRPRCVRRKRGR